MTALNRCTVTDSLWNRYADCCSSLNFEILRPSSRRKSTADSLIGPSVSTAIGWNEKEAGRSEYLTSFLEAAASAAAAAVTEEAGTLLSTSFYYYFHLIKVQQWNCSLLNQNGATAIAYIMYFIILISHITAIEFMQSERSQLLIKSFIEYLISSNNSRSNTCTGWHFNVTENWFCLHRPRSLHYSLQLNYIIYNRHWRFLATRYKFLTPSHRLPYLRGRCPRHHLTPRLICIPNNPTCIFHESKHLGIFAP